MSKSRGNVVSPDDCIKKYGSDAFRMYLMFGFSYIEGGPWNESGIDSIVKFIERVERLVSKSVEIKETNNTFDSKEKDLNFIRNSTIMKVTQDMKAFSFNTGIARIMEYVNALYKYIDSPSFNEKFFKDCVKDLVLILAPIIPHTAEEFFEMLGNTTSVFNEKYPTYDEKALVKDEYELAVQINSKIKAKIVVPANATQQEIQTIALNDSSVKNALGSLNILKVIVIPKRLVNIVAK